MMLEKEDILIKKESKKNIRKRGVYFLIKGDDIVYVGKSIDIHDRIKTHIKDKDKPFDYYSYIVLNNYEEKELYILESKYILKYRPLYNKKYPKVNKEKTTSINKKEFNGCNIRLPKELKVFAKRLSYQQNGTLSISNGVRIALQKALKDEK